MMMGSDWAWGWGGMWFGWLLLIGFTVAVIVLAVWFDQFIKARQKR